MSDGFVKLRRGEATWELLEDRNAFVLLTVIALRARRADGFNRHSLHAGQALIGDYKAYGLSEREYRSAKDRLERYGLARFKPTNRGTIATLSDRKIYDINETRARQTDDDLATDKRRADDEQATTNKNEKNGKNEKKSSCNPGAPGLRLSELLLELIVQRKPDLRRPNLDRWARDMDRLIRLDGRTPERIEAVIRFCQRDPFWQNNILSAATLRRQFDRLELLMQQRRPAESTRDMVARMKREGKL
jgi:hypothetical protein